MKTTIQYISLIIVLALIGCNKDYLDKFPQTSITPDQFFKSEEDLALYMNGILSLPSKYIYDAERGTDNLATTAAVEMKTIMTGTPSAETISGGWNWGRLRDVNYFLDNVDNAEIEEKAKNHFIGLARYYRAIFYYDMIKRYSDVPWYETSLNTSMQEELYKPRDSREMVMEKVMEDLQFAYDHVRESVASGTPNKWAVAVMYSRIALYEGTWRKYHDELNLASSAASFFEKAKMISNDIMTSGLFSIHNTGNPETDYLDLFHSSDLTGNPEVILNHVYDNELGYGLNLTHIFTDYEQSPSKELLQTYLMRDGGRFTDIPDYDKMLFVEEFQNRDFRLQQSFAYPGWVHKGEPTPYIQRLNKNFTGYHQIKGYANTTDNIYNNGIDMPVFRYAEVLLTHAEATAELNQLDQTTLDNTINLLRSRAGVSPLLLDEANANIDQFLHNRHPNVTGSNTGAVLEIRRERRVELAFEGFRLDDIMRWGIHNVLLEAPKGIYFPGLGKYDLTGDGIEDIALISAEFDIPLEEDKEQNSLGVTLIYYRVSTIQDGIGTVYLENGVDGGTILTEITPRNFVDPQYYYKPIPQKEVLLNPNLKQIFGW